MSQPDYLTEAGTILMAAAASNRKREAAMAEAYAGVKGGWPGQQELRTEALQIADGLTRLAAISAGLPPCCCHHPEESQP